jgi:hypothetical protein
MKRYIIASIMILISSINFSQTDTLLFNKAYPIIGWDSLRSIIERPENYPEILRRAGVTGTIYVSLLIDSTGTLLKVDPAYSYISAVDSFNYKYLIPVVEKMLVPIKWHPSYKNHSPITDIIYRSFSFILINDKDKGFNILAPKHYETKSH